MKVDILAHLYHTDMLDEVTNDILNSGLEYRLFVNIPHKGPGYDALEKKIKTVHPGARVISTENTARDIGGYLRLLDLWLKEDRRNELMYFWHSKSTHGWRREMVDCSLNKKVADMFQHPKVGIVGSARWHLSYYSPGAFEYDNATMDFLCGKFNINKPFFGFIGGTIFMARSSIYEEAFKDKNPKEIADQINVPNYGNLSVLYTYERFFGVLASQKHIIIGTEISGEPFDEWHYLDKYPDVRTAVLNRRFINGYDHFMKHGRFEGRQPYDPERLYQKEPAAILHRHSAMGDVILAEPVVRALKRNGYNRIHIHSPIYASVFRPHPDVVTSEFPIWGDYFELDWVYENDRNKLIQDAYLDAYNLKLSTEEKLPILNITDDEKSWARSVLGDGKWVVIDPGYLGARLEGINTNWTSEHWYEVIQYIKTKGFKTLLVGKTNNTVAINNIDLDMRGQTNERQLFALINHANAIIGVDSGSINVAQAVKTPGIGLYDPEFPPKYRLAWGSLITPVVVPRNSLLPVKSIIKSFDWAIVPNLQKEEVEMTTRKGFESTILQLVKDYNIQEILETGTFKGTGSTRVFASTGLPVISIECNHGFYQEACRNLAGFGNVRLLHGYSLMLDDMLKFIEHDNFDGTKPELVKDVPPHEARNFYLKEVAHGGLQQNFLESNIKKDTRQLIFLDSAGGIGLLEFKKVLQVMESPILLVMDDLNHVKHYRTAVRLKQLGLDVNFSETGSWGWCYIKEKPYI